MSNTPEKQSGGIAGIDVLDDILDESGFDPLRVQSILQTLHAEHGDGIYSRIFHHLTRLDFDENDAASHWRAVLQRKKDIEAALGRAVALRTAVCDYFLSDTGNFEKPMLIEARIFLLNEQQSIIDELTGLYNRRFFNMEISKEIERSKRFGRPLSLLMFDVDHFKAYNDTFGHPEGDKALKAVAEIFSGSARSVDMVFRYGGEEFAALLPGADEGQAVLAAHRHLKAVESHAFEQGRLTVSIGAATFPKDAGNEAELLTRADRALYRAKRTGRNRVCANYDDMRKEPRYPLHLPAELSNEEPGNGTLVGTTVNISKRGMLYRSPAPMEVGKVVQAVLHHPADGKSYPLEGRTVHSSRDEAKDDVFYVGLTFDADTADDLLEPLLQSVKANSQS